jgi:hypothetical protein
MLITVCFQPVGFVTFNTRAGAEAAKQDLQVRVTLYLRTALLQSTETDLGTPFPFVLDLAPSVKINSVLIYLDPNHKKHF